jgi:hypothetical protein
LGGKILDIGKGFSMDIAGIDIKERIVRIDKDNLSYRLQDIPNFK